MGRQPCCDKVGLKRGPWTIEEDQKLMNFILNNGIQCWRLVPKLAGLLRCGKSCRLRWMNYLRPDLKRGALTEAEEDQIIDLHSRLGNKWSKIASHFPGRTDNEIKNHWNTRIKKKLKTLGIDPQTHNPVEKVNKDYSDDTEVESSAPRNNNNVELKLLDSSKMEEMSSSSSSGNLQKSGITLSSKDLDASGSVFTPRTEKSESISSKMDESSFLQDDCQQQWIDNVDYLLQWDGFTSNLEEIFPANSHHQ